MTPATLELHSNGTAALVVTTAAGDTYIAFAGPAGWVRSMASQFSYVVTATVNK